MSNRLTQLFTRIFGEKSSGTWIASTVTAGEAVGGRFSQPPGKTFIARATQYVLICALRNAEVCASQRLRLYAPASAKSKDWKGKRLMRKTATERRRLRYLKRRTNGPGTKASDYAEYAEDLQEVTEHPALDLIRRPNPWQNGDEFQEMTYLFKELAGNAFVNTYFDEAVPEMYQLAPQNTTVVPDEIDFISGYLYNRDKAKPHKFEPDEVIHFKHKASPFSPYYGIGPLQAVMLEADLVSAATQAEGYRWLNGGRPDFVVEVDSATANNQVSRDQIRAEIKRMTQGIKKFGNFLIMGNSKINALGFKPKDMEFLNGMKLSNEMIWNAFGVPQSELQLNDANYASASTGNIQYLARSIVPRCSRHAQDLTEGLLPKFGEVPGALWFAYDQIVPEDELKEAEMDRLDVAGGILKINEARANRGLEEEEGGDVLRINGVSLERLDAPPVAPMLPGGQSVNVEDDSGAVVKVLAGLLEAKHDERTNGRRVDIQVDRVTSPSPDPVHDRTDSPQGADIGALACFGPVNALKFYGAHVHTKDDRVTNAPRGTIAAIDQFAARLEVWHRNVIAEALAAGRTGVITISAAQLQEIIDEEITMILNAAARAGAREVGGSLEVAPHSALSFLNTYKVRLADAISGDLSQSLNDSIRAGLAAGETYDQVTTRINIDMPDIARWRAERIARTETAVATNEGRVFAWDELDVKEKRWLLSGNPCQFCEAVALQYVGAIPMNQPFYRIGDTITGTDGGVMVVSWRDVNGAPLHPQCACGLVPVL